MWFVIHLHIYPVATKKNADAKRNSRQYVLIVKCAICYVMIPLVVQPIGGVIGWASWAVTAVLKIIVFYKQARVKPILMPLRRTLTWQSHNGARLRWRCCLKRWDMVHYKCVVPNTCCLNRWDMVHYKCVVPNTCCLNCWDMTQYKCVVSRTDDIWVG